MRRVFLALLLFALSAPSMNAQSPIHEYRPEIVVTLPRVYGFGLTMLLEEHLAMSDLAPNEVHYGLGVVTPQFHHASAAFEARQVKMINGTVEHRYIPTLYANVPLPYGFELRDRARFEIRDIDRAWSRRYMNRSAFGRDVTVGDRALFPYAQLDFSYDTRFGRMNRREQTAGVRVPLSRGTSIDPYFTRQGDTNRTPYLLYAAGAILRVAL
jgi:hypothetical protein